MHHLSLKSCWLSRAVIFLFGVLLVMVAFPLFCRFTAAAHDAGSVSNLLAGTTGVIVSLMGLPLMVIALGRCRPLQIIEQIEDCALGRWLFGTLIVIVPGQFGWFLLREMYLPRCTSSQFSFGYCFPVWAVMFASLAFAFIALYNMARSRFQKT